MNDTGRAKVLWALGSVAVIVSALVPFVWIVSLSLKPSRTLADGAFLPRHITFDNYSKVFDNGEFLAALRNSLGIAFIATVIGVLVGAMAAYAIARLDFPGKSVVLLGALGIAMFPPISIIGSLFNLWRELHLFDTWPGLILPYITFTLPLSIWALSAFFREIPWDLEKAALVDGATPFQAFRLVILPLAAPGLVTAAILAFIFAWNDFLFAISLTSTNHARTVPAALAFFTGNTQFEQPTGAIAAAAVVVTIPVIAVVLFFQRRIVAGLTAGAVKG
jgi:multiple sugar transport system permease protein